ncbi:MAG: general secretion pathway protein GspK [Magnetococcales bacterium]|nr:general secretion pathway protein GspK [Magnetococcales bacterium]
MVGGERSDSGFALVLALMVSLIITTTAIVLTQRVRGQVEMARQFGDRTQAEMKIREATAQLLLTMITSQAGATGLEEAEWSEGSSGLALADGTESQPWNYYGEPFLLGPGITVTLQDSAARLAVSTPALDLLKPLMTFHGVSSSRANTILDSFRDWQDADDFHHLNGAEEDYYIKKLGRTQGPRNDSMQSLGEMGLLRGMDTTLLNLLAQDLTFYPTNHFNPMNTSITLLSALSTPEAAEQVASHRRAGTLTSGIFSAITAISESETLFFSPGGRFEVTIVAEVGEARAIRSFLLIMKEGVGRPFRMTEWR